MARKRRKRPSTRGLGSASEILVFLENEPALRADLAAKQRELVSMACNGPVRLSTAQAVFLPLVRRAQQRLRSSDAEGERATTALAKDTFRAMSDCVTSPFCNLPAAAERELKSGRCRR